MVVPFEASATLLADKIGVKRFRLVNEAPLAILHHSKAMGDDAITYQRERTKEALCKYEDDLVESVRAAQRRVSAAKANLKKAPDAKKRQERLARNERELADLKARATIKPENKK